MEFLSRRQLISGALLFLPLGGLLFRKPLVKWEGICRLSQRMSWSQFCEIHESAMDVEYLRRLEKRMVREGRMKMAYTKFTGSSVTWTYIFENEAALREWSELSEIGAPTNDHENLRYESRVSSVLFSQVNWFHPYFLSI